MRYEDSIVLQQVIIYIHSLQASNIVCSLVSLHNILQTPFASCLNSVQFSSASHSILSLEYSFFSLLQQYLSSFNKLFSIQSFSSATVHTSLHLFHTSRNLSLFTPYIYLRLCSFKSYICHITPL